MNTVMNFFKSNIESTALHPRSITGDLQGYKKRSDTGCTIEEVPPGRSNLLHRSQLLFLTPSCLLVLDGLSRGRSEIIQYHNKPREIIRSDNLVRPVAR